MIKELVKKITDMMLVDIQKIIFDTRNGNMQVVEEKADGDSATIADIKIGEIFIERLPQLLPNSVVINEESFDSDVFEKIKTTKYVWVVDPIDGTKAFRTKGNNEYCVAVALLDNFKPVLSLVYCPEYEFEDKKGLLFEANDSEDGARLNGKLLQTEKNIGLSDVTCINHVHQDTSLNTTEKAISDMCKTSEMIRAYDGHSTLVNYVLVSADSLQRIFTRRGANIWDIVQGAYIVEKSGGTVFYEDGTDVFPVDLKKLELKETKLLMPFNIACHKDLKCSILAQIEENVEI